MPIVYFACDYVLVEDPLADFTPAVPSLCATDGTEAGTRPILPRPIRAIERIGQRVVVVVDAGKDTPDAVLSYDRTGTSAAILPGPGDYRVVGKDGGGVFLSASASADRTGLYVTDGTPAGTRFYRTIVGGRALVPEEVRIHGPDLVFSAKVTTAEGDTRAFYAVGPHGRTRHLLTVRPPRTADGTVPATDGSFAILGDRLIYRDFTASRGQEVWAYDFASRTRRLLRDVAPGPASSGIVATRRYRDGGPFGHFDGRVYFAAAGPEGVETWSTDGTPEGTRIHPLRPGRAGTAPHLGAMLRVGTHTAIWPGGDIDVDGADDEGAAPRRLGFTDGTTAGTRSIRLWRGDVALGGNSHMAPFRFRGATWIYNPDAYWIDEPEGLFRVDLASGRTSRLAPMWHPDPDAGNVVVGGKLYFSGASHRDTFWGTGITDNEPWVSDGTPAGTHLLRELNNTRDEFYFVPIGSNPRFFAGLE